MIGKAFAMHVNAHSSNHNHNHVLDCDPKCLSECDSSPCEHSQCVTLLWNAQACWSVKNGIRMTQIFLNPNKTCPLFITLVCKKIPLADYDLNLATWNVPSILRKMN